MQLFEEAELEYHPDRAGQPGEVTLVPLGTETRNLRTHFVKIGPPGGGPGGPGGPPPAGG